MIKKRYDILLVLLLAIVCAGMLVFYVRENKSGGGDVLVPARDRWHVQVVLKAKANPPDFWRIVEQGISVAAEEYSVDCEVTGPKSERDVDAQIALVEAAIAKKPDALILAADDYERLAPVCEKAAKAGILVVSMDSDVNFDGKKCFISTDNYHLGKKLAELVNQSIGPDEKFGIMGHMEGVTTATERRNGLLDNIPNAAERLAAIDYCESNEELGKRKTIAMLKEHPEIKLMVGLNESSAIGVAYGIEEMGLAGEVKMVACDSSQVMIQLMENGTIQSFVIQNPFNMGYLSVKTTVDLLRGQTVPARVDTESVVITRENMYRPENQKLLFPFTGGE